MKAIMYHYIRTYDEKYPFFKFLDVENFRRQLDFFKDNFGFVTRSDWDNIVNRNKKIESVEGKILLTFDDAMQCHYEFVLPELQKRGLWGMFFVPTFPYENQNILDVHRIHLLCGAYKGKDLLKALLEIYDEDMLSDKKIKEFREDTYKEQSNFQGVSQFKRILNYFISYKYRKILIDELFKIFGASFDFNKFYVSEENLKKIYYCGNIIGSHTVNHPVMSKLNIEDQNIEIKKSFNFIKSINCLKEKIYCHPYGGFHSFNQYTLDILKKEKVKYAFNVEPRDINDQDFSNSLYSLPRYDCNKFPFGLVSKTKKNI